MKYSDIKLFEDDLALDGVQAAMVTDRNVILQDIVTALRVSGLLPLLVGERDTASRRVTENRIIDLVEEDTRVIPGSVALTVETSGYLLTGKTFEFGNFSEEIYI